MNAHKTDTDVEAIKQLRNAYMAAQGAGDAKGCVSFWSAEGVLMPPNEPVVVGKEALLTWYRNAFAQFSINFTISYDEIKVLGDWSFARGTYAGNMTLRDDGQSIPDEGKLLEIHVRQLDGSWKFARHMWSSDHAPST